MVLRAPFEVPYPVLVASFRPHATVLVLRNPAAAYAAAYAAENVTKDGMAGGAELDASFRLLERLFVRRDALFNATVLVPFL